MVVPTQFISDCNSEKLLKPINLRLSGTFLWLTVYEGLYESYNWLSQICIVRSCNDCTYCARRSYTVVIVSPIGWSYDHTVNLPHNDSFEVRSSCTPFYGPRPISFMPS